MAPLPDLLELYIVFWVGLRFGFSLWFLPGLGIISRLLLHALIHFPETFFNTAAGPVDRDYQFKNELVSQIETYSQ